MLRYPFYLFFVFDVFPEAIILFKQLLLMVVSCISF